MPVVKPRVGEGDTEGRSKKSIEELAKEVYEWIKVHRVIPTTDVKVENVELRKGYAVLGGYNPHILKSEGAVVSVRYEAIGEREFIHVHVKKGIVVLYNNEPHRRNTAIVVYNE